MNPLNVLVLAKEFYALEAIAAMLAGDTLNHFEHMRHSHRRWYREFDDFRSKYISNFAAAIFDYTAMVVAGELRHGNCKATRYIDGYYTGCTGRDEVYDDCTQYNPRDILKAGIALFDWRTVEWQSGYGGYKWQLIAEAGLMKDTIPDCVFVDHCVDLSHNNSVYFDKGAGIFTLYSRDCYQQFLDLKYNAEPQRLIKDPQGYEFNKLLWRANNLNIIEERPNLVSFFSDDCDKHESALLNYQPVKWGNEELNFSEGYIRYRSLHNESRYERRNSADRYRERLDCYSGYDVRERRIDYFANRDRSEQNAERAQCA